MRGGRLLRIFEKKLYYFPLIPFSLIYRIIVYLRNKLYDLEKLPVRHLPTKVISVGNLAIGGTGKTPMVEYLCRHLQQLGYKTSILSRGYGRRSTGHLVVSDGKKILCNQEEAGDEPYLLSQQLKGIPIVVDADRVRGGRLVEKSFESDCIILDDGFQHRRLGRDLDIVLLDATHPFGNNWTLPAGPLRESAIGLRRADVIVLTNFGEEDTARVISNICRFADAPIFTSFHKPMAWIGADGSTHDLSRFRQERVLAFCGIGNPKGFRNTLLKTGVHLLDMIVFPDHHVFCRKDLLKIVEKAKHYKSKMIVTTEKDWVKLPQKEFDGTKIYCLTIRTSINKSTLFFETILEIINEKQN